MAIFGRKTARQRLRSAARQSLAIPAFSVPADCTAAVLGGLWPAELAALTPATVPLAEYLNVDLQRIAHSANEKLQAINQAGLTGPDRQAAETRVVNVARAFAVLRVESTVRQLRQEALEFGTEYRILGRAENEQPAAPPVCGPDPEPSRHRRSAPAPAPAVIAPAAGLIDAGLIDAGLIEKDPGAEIDIAAESDDRRLQRLLHYIVRQEPGLSWAIGLREDGSAVLATDLAHGWIPPGVQLPAGVRLLAPARRDGRTTALLGVTELSAAYTPGDRLGRATDLISTQPSVAPRALPPVDDLGWRLTAATHGRDGLPRLVHTLAKAGAAGTGVADAEIDLLRVHLDTARYRLLAEYPEPDTARLLNCMLLAATEGIATGDAVSANYHFTWFRELGAPLAGNWG